MANFIYFMKIEKTNIQTNFENFESKQYNSILYKANKFFSSEFEKVEKKQVLEFS